MRDSGRAAFWFQANSVHGGDVDMMMAGIWLRRLCLGWAACLLLAGTGARAEAPRTLEPIVAQVAAALESHPLVGLGEHHRQREMLELYLALINDPRVLCRIDDIAVEFGNSALQDIADRYVSGESVPTGEKRRIWRDTGQWMVWDSPMYEQFFDAVRAANLRRICPRPVRVLLADPPIDWSRVHSADDYRPYRIRDRFYAELIEREVLARGRRALLIAGESHLWKALPAGSAEDPRMGQLIEQRHPGMLVSLTLVEPEIAERLGLPAAPSLEMVRGTPLAGRSFTALVPTGMTIDMNVDGRTVERPLGEVTWPLTEEVIDGVLSLGPPIEDITDPATYREPAYQAELRRRAPILTAVHGIDFLAMLDQALAEDASNPPG